MPRECLKIIESKSKVRQSRAKAVIAKVGTISSTPAISSDVAELKDMVKTLLLDKKNQSLAPTPSTTPAPVKAVEPNCVTCGGATHTKIVPLLTKMLIETRFKSMCRKQPPQITIKETPVSDLRWLLTKSDLSVFLPLRIIKTILIGETILTEVNQAPVYQAPIPQTQRVSHTDFESYVKANDAILRNMQSQGPKTPSPSKQGTKVTKDQVQNPSSQNTVPVQPSVIQSESQAPVSEPVVAPVSASMPNLKPSIPYPSRRDNEKRRDQANEQIK
nr:hypothetical protein [Tanacetum cinerariifolium]